jgi:ATP-dependent Clp protease ATP-binding subunit ClpC
VRQQPLSLVLLDEIEKAHPEVFDLLLAVLGEGRLTDGYGRLVDFRMAVICLTSNLGVTESAPVGFGGRESGDFLRSAREHFRPELFNRIDHVVPFRALGPLDVLAIVDLEMEKAARRVGLRTRGVRLTIDPEAKELLAELGFHPTRGARPLKRVIEERVVTPLAVRLAAEPELRDLEVRVVREGSPAHARARVGGSAFLCLER